MAETPTIHLMCGLVAAGKTAVARGLAQQLPAVRLSRDEWMLRLYGGRFDDTLYVERLGPCTELLWDVALAVVAAGSSVVLDWNFWSRERRSDARHRTDAVGVNLILHWVELPVEAVLERARDRLANQPADAHEISEDDVRHLAAIFERRTVVQPLPHLRCRNFGGSGISHQVVNRYAAQNAQPGLKILNTNFDV